MGIKPKKKIPQFRGVCITDFRCVDYTELPPGVQYIAWGHETCPTTNKPHLQVFAYGEQRTEPGWAKLFGKSHVEGMRGTFAENDKYCSKQGVLQELGVRPMGTGKRRDLMDACQNVIKNPRTDPFALAVDDPDYAPVTVQYGKGLDRLRAAAFEKTIKGDITLPIVKYIHGPPGAGKTYGVRMAEPDLWSTSTTQWFDGYYGQDAVLFNNLSPQGVTDFNLFLEVLDRYPVRVPIKGGFVMWKPKRIYITSTYPPEAFAARCHNPLEWTRRITTTEYISARISD